MTVSLTLTFADLAQAEQAIAAIRTLNSPATARNEPGAAAETTGDYLRKPMAAASGQILREGDAPRETGRFGGVASCPDANSEQDGSAIAAVTVKDQLANAVGVEPLPSSPLAAVSFVQPDRAGEMESSPVSPATYSPEREPGNPEVCAISLMRVSSGDSRPAAHDPLENQKESPAGRQFKTGCLDPKACKLHFTTALCWRCNDARVKGRASA